MNIFQLKSPLQRKTENFTMLSFLPDAPELRFYVHEPSYELMFHFFYAMYTITTTSMFGGPHTFMMDLRTEKEVHTDGFGTCETDWALKDTLSE